MEDSPFPYSISSPKSKNCPELFFSQNFFLIKISPKTISRKDYIKKTNFSQGVGVNFENENSEKFFRKNHENFRRFINRKKKENRNNPVLLTLCYFLDFRCRYRNTMNKPIINKSPPIANAPATTSLFVFLSCMDSEQFSLTLQLLESSHPVNPESRNANDSNMKGIYFQL